MKTPASLRVLVAFTAALLISQSAKADLLVHEPFDYAAESGVSGKIGGIGWADQSGAGSLVGWDTHNNNPGFVAIQPSGVSSGVLLNGVAPVNPYTNTFTNGFVQTGGYAGPSDGNNQADHISLWRTLAPSVTATFVNGNTSWFGFATARAYNANARAPSFTIGAGVLTTFNSGDRGDTIQSVNQCTAPG